MRLVWTSIGTVAVGRFAKWSADGGVKVMVDKAACAVVESSALAVNGARRIALSRDSPAAAARIRPSGAVLEQGVVKCWHCEGAELWAATAAARLGSTAPAAVGPAPKNPAAVGVATGGGGGTAARTAAHLQAGVGCDRH